MTRSTIVGVAGGSCAGKTTLTESIIKILGREEVLHLKQDSYYKDQSEKTPFERDGLNYDHPDAIEASLLVTHLKELTAGRSVRVPVYDFTHHIRTNELVLAEPRRTIIVEGILVLALDEIRELLDVKVFVDADSNLRLTRRLRRDTRERGRTTQSIVNQYNSTVQPMHATFVEPSKDHADIIVKQPDFEYAAHEIVAHIRKVERLRLVV